MRFGRVRAALTMLTVLLSSMSVITCCSMSEGSDAAPFMRIEIGGNSDFIPMNGISGGSGTLSDPYIIDGFEIVATSDFNGIYIHDTTAHFIVNGSKITASGTGSAVLLDRVANGVISGCTVIGGHSGVRVLDSHDIEVRSCTASSGGTYGFSAVDVDGFVVSDCVVNRHSVSIIVSRSTNVCVHGNGIVQPQPNWPPPQMDGVRLTDCSGNITISENYFSLGYCGTCIELQSCVGVGVTGNVFQETYYPLEYYGSTSIVTWGNDFTLSAGLLGAMVSGNLIGVNAWDSGYPEGGNYWYTYSGIDVYCGPEQDMPGSDGIGDTPYSFMDAIDRYPLIQPLRSKVYGKISIEGDSGFQSWNGVCSGSGTASDPYMIEDWVISGYGGITIRNTTAHFSIKGVSVRLGTGILLDNVCHGRIESSTFSHCDLGVSVIEGLDIVIDSSLFSSTDHAVILDSCVDVAVTNCTMDSIEYGIEVLGSQGVVIDGNLLRSAYYPLMYRGVGLDERTTNVTITDNDMIHALSAILVNGAAEVDIIGNVLLLGGHTAVNVYSGSDSVNVFWNTFLESDGDCCYSASGKHVRWDNGYPAGGNFWSDYGGVDVMSGPDQDEPGSDGIGDEPMSIPVGARDNYPLMEPRRTLPDSDRIVIDGNSEFTPENGVIGGNGTQVDPYILDNLRIDCSYGVAITILNTDAWFVLRDSHVYYDYAQLGQWRPDSDGVQLRNVMNGRLENVSLAKATYAWLLTGISIVNCSNIALSSVVVSDWLYGGVSLQNSHHVSIVNSNFTGSGWGEAVCIDGCNRVLVEACYIADCGVGVEASSSSFLEIIGNRVWRNGAGVRLGDYYGDCVDCTVSGNCFIGNADDATDSAANTWHGGYPAGGNYWGSYGGVDVRTGPGQDLPGSDGLGDTPHYFDPLMNDPYPLINWLGTWDRAPVASLGYSLVQGALGTCVLNSSSSWDREDDLSRLLFLWDWEDDGVWDTDPANAPVVTHVYDEVGSTYRVRVRVMDSAWLWSEATVLVNVPDVDGTLLNETFTSWSALDAGWNIVNGTMTAFKLVDGRLVLYNDGIYSSPVQSGYMDWMPDILFDDVLELSFEFCVPYLSTYAHHVGLSLVDLEGREGIKTELVMPAVAGGSGTLDAMVGTEWQRVFYMSPGWHRLSYLMFEGRDTWIAAIDGVQAPAVGFAGSVADAFDVGCIRIKNLLNGYVQNIDIFMDNVTVNPFTPSGANMEPLALFSLDPLIGNLSSVVTVDASTSWDHEDSLGSLQFRWDWDGDGIWDTDWDLDPTAAHQYATGGIYLIGLEVMDSGGLCGEAARQVSIDGSPPIANAGPDQHVPIGRYTFFNGLKSTDDMGIASYVWTFYDGELKTLVGGTPNYYFSEIGTYVVTLTITDVGGYTDVDTMVVTMEVEVIVANAGPDQSVWLGQLVTLSANASIYNFPVYPPRWWVTDGDFWTGTLYGFTVTYTYHTPGQHTVSLEIVSAVGTGLGSQDSLNVTVLTVDFGYLRVTTNPAVPGMICVDGHWMSPWGLDWVKMDCGTHTLSFGDTPGFITPAPVEVEIICGQVTECQGVYVPCGSFRVMTSPAVPSTIYVDGLPRNDWGLWVDVPAGTYTVSFGAVAGYDAPATREVVVTAGGYSETIGIFVANPDAPGQDPASYGLLRVTTSPATPSMIKVDGHWMSAWGLDWVKMAPGEYTLSFTPIPGWIAPADVLINIVAGEVTDVQGVFGATGSFRVVTSPAVPSTIYVDGLPRNDWGLWVEIPSGTYVVSFGVVPGFISPEVIEVVLDAGGYALVTAEFVPA